MLRIKEVRKHKKITAKELANHINVAESTMSLYESGKREPDFETLKKIAEYLEVSIDFLLGRKFVMTNPPENWHQSLQEDYENAIGFEKEFMEYKYGRVVFDDSVIETEKLAENGEPSENVIIYHRDGKNVKREFTKEQMDMLVSMIEAIPEKPKDI